jgi:NAD(P)-dependent dehydrogenase (short-subunit alcohol dehydrogenase family)
MNHAKKNNIRSTRRKKAEAQAERPPQTQPTRPGQTDPMEPQPEDKMEGYKGSGKLAGMTAIVTGGDSGIGRATSIAFAKEGANVVIVYLSEHEDAEETSDIIAKLGRKTLLIDGDVGNEAFCMQVAEETMETFGRIDIVVNNAAEQHPQKSIVDITADQLERTFQTNIFGMFFLVKACLPYLKEGASIINTSSVTAFRGSPHLLDYSSTKGAIITFTRSLALNLAPQKIRVNAVAPGPVWTPLIPSTFPVEKVENFGKDVPLGRAGQPDEIAPAFVFLADEKSSSYVTGQTIHVNGGEVING